MLQHSINIMALAKVEAMVLAYLVLANNHALAPRRQRSCSHRYLFIIIYFWAYFTALRAASMV